MRRIFTVSIDTELENAVEEYLKAKGIETKSEGAIQLLKKGLRYEEDVSNLKSEIERLKAENERLKLNLNTIHLPCSVCGKPMNIRERDDDPVYSDMKKRYKDWGHSSCIERQKVRK
ncbi:hypothetical protein ACNF42_07775 [Cuniculiplasma sp. SKW3]|uniref:hypothetical protein n=1 Tax=Cuniculiplasma sp. SKW3 TaxID=3400170 RepID=UPI003FD29DBC